MSGSASVDGPGHRSGARRRRIAPLGAVAQGEACRPAVAWRSASAALRGRYAGHSPQT